MKSVRLVPLVLLVAVAGCSSQEQNTAQRPDPSADSTPQQRIDKIQGDPKIPDGLKQIQSETIRRQAGMKP